MQAWPDSKLNGKIGHCRHRIAIRLPQDANDLLFRELRPAHDIENLSQIWAVAPALVKLALRDDRRSQNDKEPPWKRIAKGQS